MKPRPYQTRAVEQMRQAYRDGNRRICLVAPTGAGKTFMAAMMAERAIGRGRVLWIVHRHELVEQARATLPPGCRVETVQGLVASGERPDADVLFLDEAHHYVADQWGQVADHYRDTVTIGLTATPERSDGRPLGDIFTHLVVAAQYSELLDGGWITPVDVIAPSKATNALSMPVEEAVRKYADGRKTLVFADQVAAAEDAAAGLSDARLITGKTPANERAESVRLFREGIVRTLVNVYVLTEGFDCPDADVAVLGRGCSHASTFLQIVGRILRAAPGKERATLVDLTGVIHKHGWPTEDRDYSLEGRAIQRRVDESPPLWQCRLCGMCYQTAPAKRLCPSCGFEIPEPKQLQVQRRKLEKLRRQERFKDTWDRHKHWQAAYESLKETGRQRGYKPGWAKMRFKARYGFWPRG